MSGLSDHDRLIVSRARQLAGLPADANTEYTGQDDPDLARAEVLGEAKHLLGELADVVMLTGEDTRRLARIRVVLARFDWEHDDRQLALEAIERIVDGGPA